MLNTYEEWKDIPDWPGYQLSSLGQVRSSRPVGQGNAKNPTSHKKWRVINGSVDKDGYRKFIATRDQHPTRANIRISATVATLFHGPRPEGYVVSHLNGNRQDDRACNLIWKIPGNTLEHVRQEFEKGFVRGNINECWLFVKGSLENSGHRKINTGKVFKTKSTFVHRLSLILEGIIIPDNAEVCHTCDVPNCVNPNYLYVGDKRSNMDDMIRRGRRQGENNHRCKLSDSDILSIRWLFSKGFSQKDICFLFNCNGSTVSRIVRGERRDPNLTSIERNKLRITLSKGKEGKWETKRKVAIWLKSIEMSSSDIATVLDCDRTSVNRWIRDTIAPA